MNKYDHGDLNSFRDIRPFYVVKGMGHALAHPWETSWSVLMNVYYHKKYHYIGLTSRDLNGFQDIKPFMK